jgi:hypothetical protein
MRNAASAWITNAISELYKQLIGSLQYINDYKRAYEIIFNILHYSVRGEFLTDPTLSRDVRFIDVLSTTSRFFKNIFEIYREYKAVVSNIAREVYDSILHRLRHDKRSKYVVFCDGMSMVEALYIAYKLRAGFINAVINPGGVTETYKFLLGAEGYMAKQPNLEEVVKSVAGEAGASHAVFREYDETIHRIEASEGLEPYSIIEEMYMITLRLEAKIDRLKKEGATIALLSDHGYDVVPAVPGRFKTLHRWSPRSLSIIAPIIIIEPPDYNFGIAKSRG